MKKRLLALVMCIFVVAVLLCGCGGSEGGEGKDTTAKDMGGYEFKIAAWWDGTPNDSTEAGKRNLALHKAAEEKYNCKITYVNIPHSDIVEKFTASVLAGSPIGDIVWLEANTAIPQMANSGYIIPVDDYFDFDDPKWTSYSKSCAKFNGKYYGFAENIATTYGIWYNKTFFKNHNLPDLYELQEKNEWDWAAFERISKAATKDTDNDGKNNTFGFSEVGWEPIVERFVSSNGQSVVYEDTPGHYRFNVDNEAVKEAISFTVDLFQRGYKTEVEDFMRGNCAMFAGDGFWGSNTFQASMDDELGFVFFPKGPKAEDYVCSSINSNIMCLPANSKRPADAAMIFEAITDWEHSEENRYATMEGWIYSEEDLETCKKMFERCELQKWPALGVYDIFVEDIFWSCVKNNTTLERAIAEHSAEGQAAIDAILANKNEVADKK